MDRSLASERSAHHVFAEIVQSPFTTWRVCELAGQGIAAYARCNLSFLEDKTCLRLRPATMPMAEMLAEVVESADHLIELVDIADELEALWDQRQAEAIEAEEFESALSQIVERIQTWPGRRPHMTQA